MGLMDNKSQEKPEPQAYLPNTDLDGKFVKAEEFEAIWLKEFKSFGGSGESKRLSDNDFIDYKMWEDRNFDKLMAEHIPEAVYFRGKSPNIIFHGGCLGCKSQRLHGMDRCKGCEYFRGNWLLPELKIEGEEASTLDEEGFHNLLKKAILRHLDFEEWLDIHQDDIDIELAENGADREMDFNPEQEYFRRYNAYLKEKGGSNGV